MFVYSDVTFLQAVIGCGSCGSYDGRLILEVTLTSIGQPSLGDVLDPLASALLLTLAPSPSKHQAQVNMAKRKRPATPPVTTQSANEERDDRASRRAAAYDIRDQARRDQM